MTIIFYDGTTMECNEIYFCEKDVIVNTFHRIPIIEIQKIISK